MKELRGSTDWCHIKDLIKICACRTSTTWGPSGADRTRVGPMLVPWTLLSGCKYPSIQTVTSNQQAKLSVHVTCDISANDFIHNFDNIGNNMNPKFQNLRIPYFWSIHTFRIMVISNRYIENYLRSRPNKSNNDTMGMELVLLEESNLIEGLVQDCSNPSALAIELLQSCAEPSIYF